MVIVKKKILVADDNPAILDAIKIMLGDEGYEVETTEDGMVAQNMKKPFPDLLLLDVWMSGVDGKDVCKKLKNANATKHIPVILISATKNIEQITKDSKADGFVSKPFQMSHLLEVVAMHVNRH
jgi:CheY-like chemotaxis protein